MKMDDSKDYLQTEKTMTKDNTLKQLEEVVDDVRTIAAADDQQSMASKSFSHLDQVQDPEGGSHYGQYSETHFVQNGKLREGSGFEVRRMSVTQYQEKPALAMAEGYQFEKAQPQSNANPNQQVDSMDYVKSLT